MRGYWFPSYKTDSSWGSVLDRFCLCFHMFFLDVAPLKNNVNKSETGIAPMCVGHVWVLLYGEKLCPLWQGSTNTFNIWPYRKLIAKSISSKLPWRKFQRATLQGNKAWDHLNQSLYNFGYRNIFLFSFIKRCSYHFFPMRNGWDWGQIF